MLTIKKIKKKDKDGRLKEYNMVLLDDGTIKYIEIKEKEDG